jgi:hypothetical protein
MFLRPELLEDRVTPVVLMPGDILIADPNAFAGLGGILRVDPASGMQTAISSGGNFVDPRGVALEPGGTILVVDPNAFAGPGGVLRVDPANGAQTALAFGGNFVDPSGIAVSADGDIFIVDPNAFGGNGGIIRVDRLSGAQTVLSSALMPGNLFVDPIGIAVAPNGDLLVADPNAFGGNGGVIRVDPVTGSQSAVSSASTPGSLFVNPVGIVAASNGTIFVADADAFAGAGGVIRVDPATGAQTAVSSGGNFVRPTGIVLSPTGSLLVADPDALTGPGGVLRIDPVSGAQFPVSSGGNFVDPIGITVVPVGASGGSQPRPAPPALARIFVVGADAGGLPEVKVFDAQTGAQRLWFYAYDASYRGGVRVAAGDVNGDGFPDVITGTGPGTAAHVKVFDGRDGALLYSFFAYSSAFLGGIFVAAGDVNGDSFADIITGTDAGTAAEIKVFGGGVESSRQLRHFYAYPPLFTGGVRVAAGDVNGDGFADILTGSGPGTAAEIKVFSGLTGQVLYHFFAYTAAYRGGTFVAAGDIDGDQRADLITGASVGAGQVQAFSGASGAPLHGFMAFDAGFQGGARVGSIDRNGDGRDDFLTGAGPGGSAHVRSLDAVSLNAIDSFFAFGAGFPFGVFVAGR